MKIKYYLLLCIAYWCFHIVVLEMTLENSLEGQGIKPILKEINLEYSLEGPMLKLQYFDHLMWRVDSLEKTDVGKDWRRKKKGEAKNEMVK